MSETAAHPIPPHLLAFWREVEHLVQTLFALFSAPEVLAGRRVLMRDDHRLLTRWLQSTEAFLRRLLLIEAAQAPLRSNRRARLESTSARQSLKRSSIPAIRKAGALRFA